MKSLKIRLFGGGGRTILPIQLGVIVFIVVHFLRLIKYGPHLNRFAASIKEQLIYGNLLLPILNSW